MASGVLGGDIFLTKVVNLQIRVCTTQNDPHIENLKWALEMRTDGRHAKLLQEMLKSLHGHQKTVVDECKFE